VTALLETHKAADIILIQEIPWANYKRIASVTNKAGDIVMGMVRHAFFICMGDTESSSVCFYINKHLLHLSLVIEDVQGLDKDVALMLRLTQDGGKHHMRILNIYNYPKQMCAAKALIDNEDMLSTIDLCMGDFNMHHPLWDPQETNTRPNTLAHELVAILQGHLNLCLINSAESSYTWSSNNATVKDQVLDLAWVERSIAPYLHLDVDLLGRFNSNHVVLLLTLSCTREQPPQRSTIKQGSKTSAAFVNDLKELFHALPSSYVSYDQVQSTCNDLYQRLNRLWHKHAITPRPSRHSSSWWNDECSEICRHLSQMHTALRGKKKARKSLLSSSGDPDSLDCL
jgi:hypothetical protein